MAVLADALGAEPHGQCLRNVRQNQRFMGNVPRMCVLES
jgi:hypothetical protein